jgi:hypothetical protein
VKEATSWRTDLLTGGAVDLPMLRGVVGVVSCARSKALAVGNEARYPGVASLFAELRDFLNEKA